ncbi:MAG: hypothetical protein LBU51_00200 [Bacteroidales bacterium]|jgi:hypothetical protein|nr:hypothetical protein [Bacteroidales bacterium]
MDDKKLPATPETRNRLYENMGKTIEMFSPTLKKHIILKELLNENALNNESRIFDAFLSLSIYTQYTSIELASVLRACFRANLPAEKRYNIKWINCVILETYKHLYGYGGKRQKSLWILHIKSVLELVNDSKLIQDCSDLENHIIEFGKSEITSVEQRNLSFHYDIEPISVYEMLMKLSEEEEGQRLISFMKLLEEITFFTAKYIGKYKVTISEEPKLISKYAFTLSEFDIFQNKGDILLSVSENAIKKHAEQLDGFIRHQNIPAKINQHFESLDKESVAPIHRLLEIEKVAIQLTFLYIDLASALKAFISSEYVLEKQLSLKQVNTIIYEGFNKIYGLDDDSQNSFWRKYICPVISQTTDITTLSDFDSMDKELQKLKLIIKSFGNQRQLSVHIDKGIIEVYSMLYNMNPFKELKKALLLLNFLPKVLDFLTKCLNVIGENSKIIHDKKMAATYEKMDNIISLIKKSPNTQQKEDLIKMLGKFKTGEFFE